MSPVPVPLMAEMGSGVPSGHLFQFSPCIAWRMNSLSALFAVTMTGVFDLSSCFASARSSVCTPLCASTTNKTRSASLMAVCVCLAVSFSIWEAFFSSIPPVSMRRMSFPRQIQSASNLSLVVPAIGETRDFWDSMRRLKRVDLPTFVLPAMTTLGGFCSILLTIYRITTRAVSSPKMTKKSMPSASVASSSPNVSTVSSRGTTSSEKIHPDVVMLTSASKKSCRTDSSEANSPSERS